MITRKTQDFSFNGATCLIRQARDRAMGGDLATAVEYLMRAVAMEPQYSEAFALLGDCYDELSEHDQAIASYDQALRIDPHHADAWFNKGMSLRSIGRDEEAAQCIARSIELYCGR
ncbi:MAG: tetratricopeptide repeat protein [Methanoculleus sp.]